MSTHKIDKIKPPYPKGRVVMITAERKSIVTKFNAIVEGSEYVDMELVKVSNETVPVMRLESVQIEKEGKMVREDKEVDSGKTRRKVIQLAKFKTVSYTHPDKVRLNEGERLILRCHNSMPVYHVDVSYQIEAV